MAGETLRNRTLRTALADAEARYTAANPESRRRHDAATVAMPGGNTRTVLFYAPFPLTVVRGEGAQLWDADGHAYADFLGEYTAGLYGHSHPVIVAAVKRALDDGIVLGGHNLYEAGLAAALTERFPSLDLVRFCNSGTEANLMAIATARAVTGRARILVFEGAYHGGVFSYAAGGSPLNAPYPTVIGRYNDPESAAAAIADHAGDLACVVVEPMLGAGGCIPAEPEFLRALREATAREGVVLIFDEVMTSRLAPGGLQAVSGVTPDLTTLGKYLGGGLSFGAFGGRADIMARFDPRHPGAFPHAGTFNNNVLTMAAGLAGLSDVWTPDACAALNRAGEGLRGRLAAAIAARGLPLQVTGRGSMMTLHLHDRPLRAPSDAPPADARARALVHLELLARGHYTARRGMMILSLASTADDIDGLVAAFDEVLDEYGDLLSAA